MAENHPPSRQQLILDQTRGIHHRDITRVQVSAGTLDQMVADSVANISFLVAS